jgi:hypothetical protein
MPAATRILRSQRSHEHSNRQDKTCNLRVGVVILETYNYVTIPIEIREI